MVMNVSLSYTDIERESANKKNRYFVQRLSIKFSFWQKKMYNEKFYMTKMADDWTMYH